MSGTVFVVAGAVAVAAGIGVFAVWGFRSSARDIQSLRLAGSVLLAAGVFAVITGWLLTDGSVNASDAVRTGGLAAGSIVALYALWLNDRRRRVDEDRQRLESARAEHDRERAADERFLRAVELLGSEADQVRVGALHALAGVARARPEYTQDVLDVICSYLRRPFDHPRYFVTRGGELPPDSYEERKKSEESDRWRQVRQTAQRLIADLLPVVGTEDAPAYDLDLQGATLEYLDISHRVVGELRARELKLYESNSFHHCEIRGPAWFTNSQSWGRLFLHHMIFAERSWFSTFTAHDVVDMSHTTFRGAVKLADSCFLGPVDLHDATFEDTVDAHGMRVSVDHGYRLPQDLAGKLSYSEGFGQVP